MKNSYLAAAAMMVLPAFAQANTVSVDLSGWAENGYPNNNAGTWSVQQGNDSVIQSINGAPTVFFDDGDGTGSNAQGTALSGTIRVNTTSDNDFIGFVLGYEPGEITSTNADFWLIDWKQGAQSGQNAGLSLSHVSGDLTGLSTGVNGQWWQHSGPIMEVAQGINLATTGWADNTLYKFDLTFTGSLIEVFVDDVLEISYAGNFTDGGFGFYNFSQRTVEYAGLTERVLPPAIPLPAGLPLLLAGLGAFGVMRRRQRR